MNGSDHCYPTHFLTNGALLQHSQGTANLPMIRKPARQYTERGIFDNNLLCRLEDRPTFRSQHRRPLNCLETNQVKQMLEARASWFKHNCRVNGKRISTVMYHCTTIHLQYAREPPTVPISSMASTFYST